tara:strand:+ start:17809 stop:17979 length:171 start_codon:yes stop_codon:yes gene_type:complete
MTDSKYLELCNKYFAPLDEISEAIENQEGLMGMSYEELMFICNKNIELSKDLETYY